jgi:hypothetical protein
MSNIPFKLKAALVAGIITIGEAAGASNINRAGAEDIMTFLKEPGRKLGLKEIGETHAVSPPETIRMAVQQAQVATEKLREFMLGGNQTRAEEFLRIYDDWTSRPETESGEFSEAFMVALRERVMNDPELGPIFNAYWGARTTEDGGLDLTQLAVSVSEVFRAAASGSSEAIDELRRQYGEYAPAFVDGIVTIYQGLPAETESIAQVVPVPVRTEDQTETDAGRAAEFIGNFARASDEADSRGHDQQYFLSQLRTILTRYRDGEGFDSSFLGALLRRLGERERAVLDGFSRRERIGETESLTFANFERFLDDVRIVSRELRAGEQFVNIANLRRVYGDAFVAAMQRLIPEQAPMRLATLSDLREKIDSIRAFAGERHIGLTTMQISGRTLDEWENDLEELEAQGEDADQERINEMNANLPSANALLREDREARRIASRLDILINGTRPFYYNIGESWLSMARSLLMQADDRGSGAASGGFFTILLTQELRQRNMHLGDVVSSSVDEESGDETSEVSTGVRTVIERISDALPLLRSISRMVNGGFRESDMASTRTMISGLPEDLFPQDVRDAMEQGFEQTVRSATETGYDAGTIRNAIMMIRRACSGLDRQIQDRLLMGTVSSWDYEVGQSEEGDPRLQALDDAYSHIASGAVFSEFQEFTGLLEDRFRMEAESAQTGLPDETAFDDVLIRDARSRLTRASEIFRNSPLEERFAIFQLFEAESPSGEMSSGDIERIAAVISGLEGLPPAYAALLIRSTGPTLFSDYDAQSIEVILSAISMYSQPLINAGMYRELEEYYSGLGDRIADLFVDVVALRNVAREQGGMLRDVRVRLPPDRPEFADLYIPASRITISLPKRIYERWVSEGAVVRVTQAPDITEGPAPSPSMSGIEREFFGRDAIAMEMNVPMPLLSLPLVIENLGALRPRYAIPVEEMNELWADASGAVHSVTGPDQDAMAYSFGEAVGQRGGGRDWSQSVYGTGGDGQQHILGNLRWNNQPLGGMTREGEQRSTTMTRGNFDVDVQGSMLERLMLSMDATAPSGSDTGIYFLKEGDAYRAYVFQRFGGGSFGLVDVRTFTEDEARMFYERTFESQPWRLYGGARISGGDAGGSREDWMAQMDGAVLFSGLPSDDEQFQGAGAAVQVGHGGGAVDYEHTRGQRSGLMGAYIDPEEREYYVGRLYLSALEESAERPGVGVHGEFQYFRARRGTIDAFLGSREVGEQGSAAEDIEGGIIASYLGEGWWGGGRGGYMMSQMIRPQAEGAEPALAVTRQQIAGGSVYGGTDLRVLAMTAAASAVWTQELEDRPADATDEEWQQHIAAALSLYIPAIRSRLMGGAVQEENYWTGGHGIVSVLYPLEWLPELSAFGIYLQGGGEHEGETLPIVGANAELAVGHGTRFRVQGFGVVNAGAGADLRAFFGTESGFDFSVNGVYTDGMDTVGQGISGALRLRLGEDEDEYRVRLILAGGYSEQEVAGETITSGEGAGIVRVNLAEPGTEPTVTDVHVGVSGVHTQVTPLNPDEAAVSADQVDAQLGVTVGTADWSFDTHAGVQYWTAEGDERLYISAGGEYQLWSGEGDIQGLTVGGRFNGLVYEEGNSRASDYNFTINLRLLNM